MTDMQYTVVVVPDTEEGGYYAFIPDLQGCMGDGDTPQDAVADVISAAECWAAVRAEQGREMPEPGESERVFEAKLKERDETIAELESQVAKLKDELRNMERSMLSRNAVRFSRSTKGFQAA